MYSSTGVEKLSDTGKYSRLSNYTAGNVRREPVDAVRKLLLNLDWKGLVPL